MLTSDSDELKDLYLVKEDFGSHKKDTVFLTYHGNDKIYYLKRDSEKSTPTEYVASPMEVDLQDSNLVEFVRTVGLDELDKMIEDGSVIR